MNEIATRPLEARDYAQVVELNSDEVAWTSPMDRSRLAHLAGVADFSRVAADGDSVVAFLLAMSLQSAYENDNLDWFRARYGSLVYVDRVVVKSESSGTGIASGLYRELLEWAGARGLVHIGCEYVLEPLNEASQRFHAGMGFREIGRRALEGKLVSMQVREVASG